MDERVQGQELTFDKETRTNARVILSGILNSSFISGLVILDKVMAPLQGPTEALQSRSQNILSAYKRVRAAIEEEKEIRMDLDAKWEEEIWPAVEEICAKQNLEIVMPRRASRSVYRSNVNAENASEYMKISVATEVFDQVIMDLETRFGEDQLKISNLIALHPDHILDQSPEELYEAVSDAVNHLTKVFESDEKNDLKEELRGLQMSIKLNKEYALKTEKTEKRLNLRIY